MTTPAQEGRFGRFTVRRVEWEDPTFAAQILARCVPVRIEAMFTFDGFDITAYSADFRPSPSLVFVPDYSLDIEEVETEDEIVRVFRGFVSGFATGTTTRRKAGQ